MSGENDTPKGDDEAIDAQFEPAPPAADYVKKPEDAPNRPGWAALGVTGLVATIFGALIGAGLSTMSGQSYAPGTLVSDVQEIAEDQNEQAERLVRLIEAGDERVSRELATVAAARGDDEAVKTLADEIEGLKNQLDALDVTSQEEGEAEVLNMGEIISRLETLERADEEDVVSPRLANRAISALRSRVEEMEQSLEGRRESVQDLFERIAVLETAVAEGGGSGGDGVSSEALAELRAEIERLKAREAADPSAADQAELEQLVEELRENDQRSQASLSETRGATAAAFAMLSVDAAVRDGRPFQSALAQLEAALPDNRSVAKLRPLAARGVPTLSELQTSFEAAREDAENTAVISETAGGDDGWSWVRRAFGDSVSVRRKGEADDGFASVMSTAASALARRDLGAAIAAVEAIENPRAEAFEDWLASARDRKTLDDALDEVRLTLMTAEQ